MGAPKRERLPITPVMLQQVMAHLTTSSHMNEAVIWAVACTAFFGFFWLGELLPESADSFAPASGLTWPWTATGHLA